MEAELWVPPFPLALDYLWSRYLDLRLSKSPGFNGHTKVEWRDIEAYVSVTKFTVLPWEARLIRSVDDIFCRVMAESHEGTTTEKNQAIRDSLQAVSKGHVTVKKGG